ncbi:hypothetical protein [Sphingomonas prati]|uniref:Uncharacterized protein n=1 Tax=Sphingomonas prati TaxID=1843237 RepID=A0A7W9F4J0_9SPHN|nr:hypothetical protein [Sphingomonas prati]MBB5730969.1 hypothetical protein [Sphingomonas prati]GGE98152.1 hypothetical protein GCM10011404_34130 [Sphingomonas prati]
MIDVFEALLKGDATYPAAFMRAKVFWDEFFAEHSGVGDAELKTAVEGAQIPFQWAMEEVGLTAPFAKGIMAVTCVGSLYDDGFAAPELAARVVEAMRTSRSLSLGIGSSAEEVSRLYQL